MRPWLTITPRSCSGELGQKIVFNSAADSCESIRVTRVRYPAQANVPFNGNQSPDSSAGQKCGRLNELIHQFMHLGSAATEEPDFAPAASAPRRNSG